MRLGTIRKTGVALVLLAVLAVMPTTLFIRHQGFTSAFAQVEMGESQERVVQRLGLPSAVGQCGGLGGTPPDHCAEELSYISPLVFWDVWVVSVDADNRVVRKLRYRSP
jgi:hypothetical protein